MGTKSAAFTSKIRTLQEACNRVVSQAFPQPSPTDIANTLKYFSQTLLSVLKDVPSLPLEVICSPEKDHWRCSTFPSLDYNGLYNVLVQLLECLPQIQGGVTIAGSSLLHTISCLVPFLEHEYMDTLPYLVASAMAILPNTLHKDLLDILCYNLLPFTISNKVTDGQNFTDISVPAIMMLLFFNTDNPAFYTQLLECLMKLKRNIAKDLFCIIAYGSVKARCPAVELLFQFWPELNPSPIDRKNLSEKHAMWSPLQCQHENCASSLSNEALKMCIDHTLAIGSGDRAPPLLICIECADQIYKGRSRETLVDILLPVDEISYTCENKACKSPLAQKIAVATCFAIECANYNSNKPVRYCQQCDETKHSTEEGKKHVVQKTIPSPWSMDSETLSYFVEAIISLLKEAQPITEKQSKEGNGGGRTSAPHSLPTDESNENMALEERQLLSRYGVWLMTSLCTPNDNTPEETLGRLLSMLFQWFHYTACLPDDQAGSALERLKGESIHGWLMKVVKTHFYVFVNCLLPHPKDYAKVGGHWDCWPSQTNQIKEGFKQLLCLVPYDIITVDVWSYIMPYWMECFRHEVTQEELAELKILLSKVLDPDLSPLGLTSKQMYQFISIRFENTTAPVQEQALYWLQILTMLEVPVPMKLLLSMFDCGVKSLANKNRENEPFSATGKVTSQPESNEPTTFHDQEISLNCYILMLDILVKQMEYQELSLHKGVETNDVKPVLSLLCDILQAPWVGTHTCENLDFDLTESERVIQCLFCEMCAIWYQLALILIESFCPVMEVTMTDVAGEAPARPEELGVKNDIKKETFDDGDADTKKGKGYSDSSTSSGASKFKASLAKECEVVEEQANPLAIESVVTVKASAVTVTDDSIGEGKYTVSTPEIRDENNEPVFEVPKAEDGFWYTTHGKFKFTIDELPISLKLFYILLKQLDSHKDADILYHILYSLKLMSLHAEVLNKAAKNHRGFLIWCQENLLISNLWSLSQAEFSQISQLCVPVLLHCITLPAGRDVFWKIVELDFHDSDWRARFRAVERVTTIAHFLEPSVVKNSPLLQSSLANAFCYLVHCLDDKESTVSQRALLNLESIKTSSLKLIVWCLETQFDLVIMDRPIILQTVFQLYNHLSDRRFLTWDFFLNRFDALFLEAQLNLEKIGELSFTRDLKNSNVNSEVYQKKLSRAHEALTQMHISRSLSISFAEKLPYKRTMSAPATDTNIQEKPVYPRQVSAPTMRRKSSKFTGNAAIPEKLSQHLPNSFLTDNQMREKMAQEESHLMHVVHRVVEMEDHDRDTMHSLIFLLMQFLSRPDQSHPQEEKAMARNQQIVLRHLNILLGYSPTEKMFLITPSSLRNLPTFNAVIASMPKVLDFNYKMGTLLLTTCLPLLIYCPSPLRYISEASLSPHYSLWLLQPHVRRSWLMSVFIIMYKYSYNMQPLCRQIQLLVQIIMNTLESQFHRCKPLQDQYISPVASRSRDLSTASMDLENIQEQEGDVSLKEVSVEEANDASVKGEFSGESTEMDEEPELEMIPESPKSEDIEIICRTSRKASTKSTKSTVDEVVICIEPKEDAGDSDGPKVTIQMKSRPSIPETSISIEEPLLKDLQQKVSESIEKEKTEKAAVTKPQEIRQKSEELNEVQQQLITHRSPSPKLGRLQRMSAVEGSLKLKKPKVEKHLNGEEIEMELRDVSVTKAPFPQNELIEEHSRVKQGMAKILTSFDEKETDMKKEESAWITDHQSPSKIKPILPPKPAPERLLPIGKPPFGKQTVFAQHSSSFRKGFPSTDFKHVTGELMFPTERLLPIGPVPFLKDTKKRFTSPPRCQQYYVEKRPEFRTDLLTDSNKAILQSLIQMQRKSEEEAEENAIDVALNAKHISHEPSPPFIDGDSDDRIEEESEPLSEKKTLLKPIDTLGSITPALPGVPPASPMVAEVHSPPAEETCAAKRSSIPSTDEVLMEATIKLKSVSETQAIESETEESKSAPITVETKTVSTKPSKIKSVQPSIDSLAESPSLELLDEVKATVQIEDQRVPRTHYKRRQRKSGLTTVEAQRSLEGRNVSSVGGVAANVQRRARKTDSTSTTGIFSKRSSTSQSSGGASDDSIHERCPLCGNIFEEFTEEDIAMCIVILGTYIHREPGLAANIMPEMLLMVAKYANLNRYPWQCESSIYIPGNSNSIAKQFLRCSLHQLSTNGIFQRLFSSYNIDENFLKAMSTSLSDYVELNQISPLTILFEDFNERKHLPSMPELLHILSNIALYLKCLNLEATSIQLWSTFFPLFETFLRKLTLLLPNAGICNLTSLVQLMLITLKLTVINNHKTILEPYSKIISHAILQSPIEYEQLLELCHSCGVVFTKDRDRYLLTRAVVFELHQAIKFKTLVPDENLMILVQFLLQDAGGTLVPSVIIEDLKANSCAEIEVYNTNAVECWKQYVMDAIDFVADVHTLTRVKSNFLGTCIHLNEETLGGHLKAGLSQFLALEITKGNGRDHKAITRYLPWLYSLPSVQQGAKEFLDCVAHIRLLSWILLGSLQHSAVLHTHSSYTLSQPIPLEANGHIAEHIQVILAGFAEQSKASVLHMSSLFHAFILCQLWTMYCENISIQNPPGSEQYTQCTLTLSDFWAKITPGILQLICHSKVLAEMVSLHFLSLMETLMDCNSNILARLLPMWTPVFHSYDGQLSSHLMVRLQACVNWQPPSQIKESASFSSSFRSNPMLRWLQKLQFKMGQIEMQSSAATQLYTI
ncbi:protein unc-79-like protein [Leptotrombidium deliense]|uniref:Protein unc-79-like protein n=1 Tax=Leptotrombidium deliense TaxID=299467 RepID=A0A443SRL6_9ACAR|nr:protein unc-79-like protein [Leptotrombidium deliense]